MCRDHNRGIGVQFGRGETLPFFLSYNHQTKKTNQQENFEPYGDKHKLHTRNSEMAKLHRKSRQGNLPFFERHPRLKEYLETKNVPRLTEISPLIPIIYLRISLH